MKRPEDATLRRLVELACRAPSVHNTQPWRWVAGNGVVRLYADAGRQLRHADPDGRDLLISCGAALDTLVTAAAAEGWQAKVSRLPDVSDLTLLATVTFAERVPHHEELRLGRAIPARQTDRRQVSSWPVPEARLASLADVAARHGASLTQVDQGGLVVLFDQVREAADAQNADTDYVVELEAWTFDAPEDAGIPDEALPVPDADLAIASFSRFPAGSLPGGYAEHEEPGAVWLLLATPADDRADWLRAGEALDAVWLACTAAGLSLVPYTQVAEVPAARAAVESALLPEDQHLQVVLRIGWPPLSHPPVPITPRRPLADVLVEDAVIGSTHPSGQFVRTFSEIDNDDVALVGGKNASLGEMYQQLGEVGVRVPNGFAVTADGYRHMLDEAKAWPVLGEIFEGLPGADGTIDLDDLADRAARARAVVYDAGLPADLEAEIRTAYQALEAEYGAGVAVAVRSSATAEDLPDASFAGQHESYLNIAGEENVLDAVRRCFASIFTDRGVDYRRRQGFDQLDVALSVGVMKMVRSDLAASGVVFTLDTESGFRDVVFLSASYGLGENVVQGAVDPDEFYVHKPTYRAGFRSVLRRTLGEKAIRMVYGTGDTPTVNQPTPAEDRARFCLDDDDVLELAGAAIAIEDHYGRPMDIEWAEDGGDGLLYIVQARPETAASKRTGATITSYAVSDPGAVIIEGRAVGDRAAVGRVHVVQTVSDLRTFQPGEVLVAETTTPDWEPVMKTASAIVTDRGGRTCHAAIVARELGVPAVVGTGDATRAVPDGATVTVSCAEGDVGVVYDGAAQIKVEETQVSDLPRPRTKVMVNLGNPDLAFETAMLPTDGVGLARMEFILTEAVKVHPLAALHPDRVADADERARVEAVIAGAPSGADYVVAHLAEGIGTIAAAFYPKPVVVRMSDFKTNEYATLLGGAAFEPVEDNPMLGFRGASRYAHPAYAEGFALECRALRRVREEMGLANVIPMLPFVRTVKEADLVLDRMAELGLPRGDGLEVYAMCEIPNNVIQIDEFAERFDGFSIGSNDLTQLTLGVDRDSEIVAFDYDERDPGVMRMLQLAVEGCHRNHIHSGICGQAPSDYPEVAEFLVGLGIDSISLDPATVVATTRAVLDIEARAQS